MSIEKIVRPNETLDVGPRREPPLNPAKPEKIRITPGIVGTTRTMNGSGSETTSYYMDADHGENGP